LGIAHLCHFVQAEGNGLMENIGFERFFIHLPFQKKDFPATGIHQDLLVVLAVVEMSVLTYETVVQFIEVLSQGFIRHLVFRFIIIKSVVGIPQVYVEQHFLSFLGREVYGLEHSVVLHITDKHSDLKVRSQQSPLSEVFVPFPLIEALLHSFLLVLLPP
jgi:hypothetical protein